MSAREIAGISFGRERKGVLVALRVYLDGSGKEDDHALITVGGFLAETSVCEDIEKEWEDATRKKVFHLKKFGTSKCALGSKGWSETKRSDFLNQLAGIVNRSGCYIISATLEIKPFNDALNNLTHPHEVGPAFSACAFAAICYAEEPLIREKRQLQHVRYIFEKGDREHEIAKVFRDWEHKNSKLYRLRGHGFEPKHLPLLQPADLIAGVVQRCAVRTYNAFPCLDNGRSRTPLNTFERHYSKDGVTAATVSGHDNSHCWIVNPKSITGIDDISANLFNEHPELLPKRLKHTQFKPQKEWREV